MGKCICAKRPSGYPGITVFQGDGDFQRGWAFDNPRKIQVATTMGKGRDILLLGSRPFEAKGRSCNHPETGDRQRQHNTTQYKIKVGRRVSRRDMPRADAQLDRREPRDLRTETFVVYIRRQNPFAPKCCSHLRTSPRPE